MWRPIVLLALVLTGCASVREQTTARNGAIADSVTTIVAIQQANAVELNPLGVGGTIIAKAATVGYIHFNPHNLSPQELDRANRIAGSAWLGAAANNLMIIAGSTNPIAITTGLLTGLALWANSKPSN